MTWIHELPTWIAGVAIIGFFVGSALTGLRVTRGWSRRRGLHALVDNGVIGWIFSAILGVYAIAIGLIAVASWSNASDASLVASREAAQIAGFYRDFGGYPEPIRRRLEGLVVRYTEGVIGTEWPKQQSGLIPDDGVEILNEIESVLYAFAPGTAGLRLIHAEALRSFNDLVELRRRRLEAVDYAVPATLWSVVLVGAVLSIGASYVFSMESFPVHAIMTGLLAAMISLLVFFIAVTDHPYHGRSSVPPEPYELVLRDIDRR
jgi:hypothetical protein